MARPAGIELACVDVRVTGFSLVVDATGCIFTVAVVRVCSLQSEAETRDETGDGLVRFLIGQRLKKDLLSARAVATIKEPGRHSDGGNLYLYVSKTGNRSWTFMWSRNGKQREMGLGPVGDITLAEARDKAREARRHLLAGRDPLVERDRDKQTVTFGEFADTYVETMKGQWSNSKTAHQWRVMLTTNAAPLRSRPIADVDTEGVLGVLKPMWTKTPEMAVKARSRIEAVLDAAKAKGLRHGENPARWRGHLDQLLPKRPSLVRGHHAAMPYAEVPAFLELLTASDTLSFMALRFTILTAVRTGEALGARWSEFDFASRLWTVPLERMKAGRQHRVPLSESALGIARDLYAKRSSDFVFPGIKPGRPLSNMSMLMVLRGLDLDVTVHGFRSSFRDWAAEVTDFPSEVAEMALAHVVADAVERAYRRGDLFEKRRGLMEAWAGFCTGSKQASISERSADGGQ